MSSTTWEPVVDGTSCGDAGQICLTALCSWGCVIGPSVYESGALNPTDSCQSCQSSISRTGWNALADGTGCNGDGGEVCTGGSCQAGCFIGGTRYGPGVAESDQPLRELSASSVDRRLHAGAGRHGLFGAGGHLHGRHLHLRERADALRRQLLELSVWLRRQCLLNRHHREPMHIRRPVRFGPLRSGRHSRGRPVRRKLRCAGGLGLRRGGRYRLLLRAGVQRRPRVVLPRSSRLMHLQRRVLQRSLLRRSLRLLRQGPGDLQSLHGGRRLLQRRLRRRRRASRVRVQPLSLDAVRAVPECRRSTARTPRERVMRRRSTCPSAPPST